MNRSQPWLLVISLLLAVPTACGDGEGPTSREVQIGVHLRGGFRGDFVEIAIDGNQVYADTATSDLSTGFPDGALVSLVRGEHSISAAVNDTVRSDSTFATDSLVVIGVRFSQSIPQVYFLYYRESPVYY